MDDKYMTNDILESTKSDLTTLQGVINEAENIQLRQTIQQIRNNEESFQYEMLKIAQIKDYKSVANQASQSEIEQIKNELQ